MRKCPFANYQAAKHPKHSKFAITDMQQKSVDFFLLYCTGIDFSACENFANLSFSAKVSVPVQSIIPWLYSDHFLELSSHSVVLVLRSS